MSRVVTAHALSIDVEDWFQVLNLRAAVSRAEWDQLALRCGDSTRRLLDLFAKRGASATFFFLGWVAERLPDLVREVAAAGHEVASHGYDHQLLGELGPEGFQADLARTEAVLRGITGAPPQSFRACTWSVTAATQWAVPILIARGYRLDSSVFPVRHPDYGVPGAPTAPYHLRVETGALLEVPPLTLSVLGKRVPVGGGGYLRLFPVAVLAAALRRQQRAGWPGCVYLHPWEVDPDQPRRGLRGVRAFRHYVNLRRTLPKLERLLSEFRFAALAQVAADLDRARVPELSLQQVFGDGARLSSRG